MTDTVMWPGLSSRECKYCIFTIGSSLNKEPGNYIFAKQTSPGYWAPCYIGQTQNLNERLADHGKETCAKRNGATHIHAHLTPGGEAVRKAEEADLIQKWRPPCNDQLK